MRSDDGRQSHDETRRQIDATGNDDEGLPDRQQQRSDREDRNGLPIEAGADEGAAEVDPCPDLERHDKRGKKEPCAQLRDTIKDSFFLVAVVCLRRHMLIRLANVCIVDCHGLVQTGALSARDCGAVRSIIVG